MSAAPLPKDPPSAEPTEADGWTLLDGLRRRLDDQAAQQRKTCAQVTQLAESIAALVETQHRRSRRLNLNSFVAYVMFTVLCSIAFYFVYAAHASRLSAAAARSAAERDAAVRRADDAVAKLAQREAADAAAAKQNETAVHAAKELSSHQDDVVQAAFAAIRAGRYADVVAPVEHELAARGDGPRAGQLHYLAGIAHAKTGEPDVAIKHLLIAVETDTVDDDARFQLAQALDHAGQLAKARAEYDRFATAHPQSPFAVFAIRRSAQVVKGAEPTPAPGAAQASATPTASATAAP